MSYLFGNKTCHNLKYFLKHNDWLNIYEVYLFLNYIYIYIYMGAMLTILLNFFFKRTILFTYASTKKTLKSIKFT